MTGKLREKGTFRNDKLVGEYVCYYENGQVREQEYYNESGLLEGEYRLFYRNGQIKDQEFFKNGKFDGDYVSYYKDGQLREKGGFRNEKREGEYIAYFKNGRIKEQAHYRNGKLVGPFLCFDGKGNAVPLKNLSTEPPPEDEDRIQHREQMVDNLLKGLADFNPKERSDAKR
jgi:antitoxin component YwqK of YwqJK toxin-antitoxin module